MGSLAERQQRRALMRNQEPYEEVVCRLVDSAKPSWMTDQGFLKVLEQIVSTGQLEELVEENAGW